jgi:hypothetical protein
MVDPSGQDRDRSASAPRGGACSAAAPRGACRRRRLGAPRWIAHQPRRARKEVANEGIDEDAMRRDGGDAGRAGERVGAGRRPAAAAGAGEPGAARPGAVRGQDRTHRPGLRARAARQDLGAGGRSREADPGAAAGGGHARGRRQRGLDAARLGPQVRPGDHERTGRRAARPLGGSHPAARGSGPRLRLAGRGRAAFRGDRTSPCSPGSRSSCRGGSRSGQERSFSLTCARSSPPVGRPRRTARR